MFILHFYFFASLRKMGVATTSTGLRFPNPFKMLVHFVKLLGQLLSWNHVFESFRGNPPPLILQLAWFCNELSYINLIISAYCEIFFDFCSFYFMHYPIFQTTDWCLEMLPTWSIHPWKSDKVCTFLLFVKIAQFVGYKISAALVKWFANFM